MKPIEPINFTRGDTYRFDFSFPLDGAKYKLNAGDVIRLFVFKGRQKVITKLLSIADQGADGTITVVFNPEDTSSLRPGTYEYERELITADGRTETIHRMPFIIYEDLITPENRGANVPPSSEPQAWLQARSVSYENTRSSLRSKNLQAAVDEIDGKLRDIEIPERSEIISTGIGSSIVLDCASDRHLRGLTLYGKTTQMGIPSPTNPIPPVNAGNSGSLAVNLYGRNIYKISNVTAELRGVTYSNINGALSMNGTVTAAGARMEQYFKNNVVNVPAGATVTVSTKLISGTAGHEVQVGIQQVHSSDAPTILCGLNRVGDVFTYTVTEDMNISFFAQGSTVGGAINCMFSVMINMGDTASDYEAYKEPQTLTVQTPNGLPGIPVASGGNYTDGNGQQWLCDEIDFERGVYVQRAEEYTITGEEDIVTWGSVNANGYGRLRIIHRGAPAAFKNQAICVPALCDKYTASDVTTIASLINGGGTGYKFGFLDKDQIVFSTQNVTVEAFKNEIVGTKILYQLATPVETPLTAAEIATYKALHTNKPVTTILNDGGAGMEVTYVPDNPAAIYLDKRLSDIEAAIISTGGNI